MNNGELHLHQKERGRAPVSEVARIGRDVMEVHATCVRLNSQLHDDYDAAPCAIREALTTANCQRKDILISLVDAPSLSADDVCLKRDVVLTVADFLQCEDGELGRLAISVLRETREYPGVINETARDQPLRRSWLPKLRMFS